MTSIAWLIIPSAAVLFSHFVVLDIPGYQVTLAPFTIALICLIQKPKIGKQAALGTLLFASYAISIYLVNSLPDLFRVESLLDSESFFKTFILYSSSLLCFGFIAKVQIRWESSRFLCRGVLLASILLFGIVFLQLAPKVISLPFVLPSPLWQAQILGGLSNEGRFEEVYMTQLTGFTFFRPSGPFYEPSWAALAANSLIVSSINLRKFLARKYWFDFSITLLTITIFMTFSASGILFLGIISLPLLSRGLSKRSNIMHKLIVFCLGAVLLIGIFEWLTTRLSEILIEGGSGWFRISSPLIEIQRSLDIYFLAIPLGHLPFDFPSFIFASLAYFGVGSILIIALLLIRPGSLYRITKYSNDKEYSSFAWITFLYFVYAAFATGAFLTPEFVAISSLPIVSLKFLSESRNTSYQFSN